MSNKTKIRKPTKQNVQRAEAQQAPPRPSMEVIPLDSDPDTLVGEWRGLQGMLAQINEEIKSINQNMLEEQQRIRTLENSGLQVIGQASTIQRILAGMGVDPNKYGISETPELATAPAANLVPDSEESPELFDTEEDEVDSRVAAMRKRIRR